MKKEKIFTKLSRRSFIRNSVVAAAGVTLLPAALVSCSDDDSRDENENFTPEGDFGFFEGVASFDPTQQQVVLWTRYTPATNEPTKPSILLDVSKTSDFKDLVVSESVVVDTESDNTVYVDVDKLTSNTKYYYRFRHEKTGAVSVVGETKTLPAPGQASEVKLAVVSCSNFQAGLFNVYGAVAESNADIVVHLGDYIYEYASGGYGSNESTASLNRQHKPAGEIVSLEDYRARYRQYRSDEQLQKAHQLKPFICVWDDHEIANDAYTDGAENHQPATEGSFVDRKAHALQAWHEYLPARVSEQSEIYRNFEIAGIVNLIMLDTRIVGRNKQLNYADYLSESGLNVAAFMQAWMNPQRTLLGTKQREWLGGKMAGSSATWQVLGNQVLMAKIFIPAELLLLTAQIAAGGVTPEFFEQYNTVVTQLVTIKIRIKQGDPSVTAEERARVETVLPYNLDSWDGYPTEREAVFAAAKGKKLISLAGDTHNAWYSDLLDAEGNKVGAEFATASVSSPGFEAIFGTDPTVIAGFQMAYTTLVDGLIYVDAARRGYVMATFSSSSAKADWQFVSTLATKNTTTESGKIGTES
jgi:alkaline phosphatase D